MENNNMKYINSHFSMEEIAKMVALTIDGVYPKSKNDSNNSEENNLLLRNWYKIIVEDRIFYLFILSLLWYF